MSRNNNRANYWLAAFVAAGIFSIAVGCFAYGPLKSSISSSLHWLMSALH